MPKRKFRNTALLILNTRTIGGAEKRFAYLFEYIISAGIDNYFLITTSFYLSEMRKLGFLKSDDKIILIDSDFKVESKLIGNRNSIRKSKIIYLKRIIRNMMLWRRSIGLAAKVDGIIRKHLICNIHTYGKGAFIAGMLRIFNKKFCLIITYMDASGSNLQKGIVNIPNSYLHSLKTSDHIDFLGKYYYDSIKDLIPAKKRISFSPCSFIKYRDVIERKRARRVLFAGRFIDFKNPLLFIRIAEYVLSRDSSIEFLMFGSGVLEPIMLDQINNNGYGSKIKIQYTYDLWEEFNNSMIFLSLQQKENYPSQSIIEAMACENVVIATNVGETHKLVPEGCGYVIDPDIIKIGELIISLLDDPLKCKKIGEQASVFVRQNHTVDRFTDYVAQIYTNVE